MDGEALLVYVFLNVAEVRIDISFDLTAYAQDDVKLTGRRCHDLYAVKVLYVLLQQTPHGRAGLFLKSVAVEALVVLKRLHRVRGDHLNAVIALDDVEQSVYPCVDAVGGEHAQVGGRNGEENELTLLRRYAVICYSLNAKQLLRGFFLFEDHVGSLHSKYCWRVKKYAAA